MRKNLKVLDKVISYSNPVRKLYFEERDIEQ